MNQAKMNSRVESSYPQHGFRWLLACPSWDNCLDMEGLTPNGLFECYCPGCAKHLAAACWARTELNVNRRAKRFFETPHGGEIVKPPLECLADPTGTPLESQPPIDAELMELSRPPERTRFRSGT